MLSFVLFRSLQSCIYGLFWRLVLRVPLVYYGIELEAGSLPTLLSYIYDHNVKTFLASHNLCCAPDACILTPVLQTSSSLFAAHITLVSPSV